MAEAEAQAPPAEVVLPAEMPPCYLGFCKGDRAAALALYNKGLEYRKTYGLDTVLNEPYANFESVRKFYHKFIHGKTKLGETIVIEAPGDMDFGGAKEAGLGRADIVKYSLFVFEYVVKVLDPRPEATVAIVIDLKDISFWKLASLELFGTIREISDATGAVFCRRTHRYFIINAPSWFETIFGFIAGALPAGARESCVLCHDANALEEHVERSVIPKEWGGDCPNAIGDSQEEQGLKAYVASKGQ